MGATKDGGPAFPVEPGVTLRVGMTLRDWFAGQALAGMMANPGNNPFPADEMAHDAYLYADAMLAERAAK